MCVRKKADTAIYTFLVSYVLYTVNCKKTLKQNLSISVVYLNKLLTFKYNI